VGRFTWAWILAAFCLVVSVEHIRVLRAACTWRWLTGVGVASYSIYLVHQPLLLLFSRLPLILVVSLPILSGFVFWWLAERPWVDTPLRARAIAVVEARLSRYAIWLRVPHPIVPLQRKTTQRTELVA
jgi:peptidoglycan/LPS O-acetylase OafA/YrhL